MKKLTKIKLLTMCSALVLNATFAAEVALIEDKNLGTVKQEDGAKPAAQSAGWTLGGALSYLNPFSYSWFSSASPEEQKVIQAALTGDEDAFGEAVVSHAMLQLSPAEQEDAITEMQKAQLAARLEGSVEGFVNLPEGVREKMIAAVLEPESTEALVAASKAIMEVKGLDGAVVLDKLTALIKAAKEAEGAMPALIPADEEEDLSAEVRKMAVREEVATSEPSDITDARARIAELEAEKTKNGKLSKAKRGQLGALKNKVHVYERTVK